MQEVMLTTNEAAEVLGLSSRQVARLVVAGVLRPAFRGRGIRGPMFFLRTEVERVAAERAGRAV